MEYVSEQLSTCMLLFLTGIIFGVYLDLYRVLRGVFRVKRSAAYYGDLLFWLVALGVFTPLLYWSTWLELRLYVWLSLILGVCGYYLNFSQILIPMLLKFLKGITWLPRQVGRSLKWLGGQMCWVSRLLFRHFFNP